MAVTGAAGYISAAAAVAGAGVAAYGAVQAAKAPGPKMPVIPVDPKPPKVSSYATDVQKAQMLAASAGGTILSDQTKNRQIGTDPNAPRKTLLGV
jgi:hypothetical protein